MNKEQNHSLDKNNKCEYNLQKYKTTAEGNAMLNIETYEDLFSIIRILFEKYMFPNIDTLSKANHFNPSNFQFKIGTKYLRRENFEETLYFVPDGAFGSGFGSSFISPNTMLGLSTYDLKEIFYDLYPPQQILSDFYKTLITFAKNNQQQIKGLNLPLQFMKLILENEGEYKS